MEGSDSEPEVLGMRGTAKAATMAVPAWASVFFENYVFLKIIGHSGFQPGCHHEANRTCHNEWPYSAVSAIGHCQFVRPGSKDF